MDDLKNEIEAILFASGRKVSLKELETLLDVSTPGLVVNAVEELKKEYQERNSPIILLDESDGWKLSVREKYLNTVQKINPYTELSKATMETLAVIAWKQPITQAEVVNIRSNKAYEHITELVDLGFISKEKFGRSFILKLTQKFMDYFDLPDAKAAKKLFHEFKDEDAQIKLGFENNVSGDSEHLGNLEIYDAGGDVELYEDRNSLKESKASSPISSERVGDLDVYSSPNVEQEVVEEQDVEDGQENLDDSQDEEQSQADKAKRMAQELLGEDDAPKEDDDRDVNPVLEEFLDKNTEKKESADDIINDLKKENSGKEPSANDGESNSDEEQDFSSATEDGDVIEESSNDENVDSSESDNDFSSVGEEEIVIDDSENQDS